MGDHVYMSTACQHQLHQQCRRVCKFCPAGCTCVCHGAGGRSPATGGVIRDGRPFLVGDERTPDCLGLPEPRDAQRRSEATPNDPFVCPTCRDIVPRRRFDSLGRHPRSGEETLCDGFAVWRHDASRVDPYDTTKGGAVDA